MKALCAIFLFFLVITNISCGRGLWGTNTGNPGVRSGTEVDAPWLTGYYSENMSVRMCAKLSECNSTLDSNLCQQEILNLAAISTELALAGKYSNLSEIISAEKAGTLVVTTEKAASCLDAIQALTCADGLVQSAYNSLQPTQFSNSYFLIRASADCALSFQ